MKHPFKNILSIGLLACVSFITACQTAPGNNNNISENNLQKHTDAVYQVALLQSLMQGEYDGIISVKDLKRYGNFGIGTFDGVNGELIALDGKVYQALSDGSVVEAAENETIPFANVKFFHADKVNNQNVQAKNIDDLKQQLNDIIKDEKNQFYFVRIDSKLSQVNVRSELKQKPPYKYLNEILKTDERRFEYKNISGTIVAIYFPTYMNGLNTPGWHLHFISDDKRKGGHVLNITNLQGNLFVDASKEFYMQVPNRKSFNDKNLEKDLASEIKKVETGK